MEHLENHAKTYGIGWTENVTAQITIHHNWFGNTTQGNPSADNILRAHLFNNVMQNLDSYGNCARSRTNHVVARSASHALRGPARRARKLRPWPSNTFS